MDEQQGWLRVPVGRDAQNWLTAPIKRRVLAVVHTVAGAGHLLDAVELLESDPRIQVVFTQAPDAFCNGVREFLDGLHGVAIEWHQAIHTEFDLALATDCAGVQKLRAPVLSLSHGVGNNKLAPPALGGAASQLVVGLAAPWLTWYGRLVPAAVALAHVDLMTVLARQCPQALPIAVVTGDACLDRLAVSRARRGEYRRALGIDDDRVIVAMNSTWGPDSLLGQAGELLFDLLAGLPDRYAVLASMHPAVWFGHGPRQVAGWLSGPRRRGLRLVDPLSWRALTAAADVMIGDHGSATIYAAAAGVPVLRAPGAAGSVRTGSAVARLAEVAPVLTPHQPLLAQLCHAVDTFGTGTHQRIAERITSEPGRAAGLLRAQMYRLLALAEPGGPPPVAPVAMPQVIGE